MSRLLGMLTVVLALLAALDRFVGLFDTPAAAVLSANSERDRAFEAIVALHFDELRNNVRRVVDAVHARWQAVPEGKRADELRVVVIGNSTAMFSLVPRILEERLAAAFPSRTVAVTPLVLPGIQALDEEVLVGAALRKHADVVILTPNLKGLVAGPSPLSGRVRELFGASTDADASARTPFTEPAAFIEGVLERHWRLYRDRGELRTRLIAGAARALS
jgi:hypothetical protein